MIRQASSKLVVPVFFERSTATEPEFLEAHKQLIESAYILHINGRHRKLMRSAMAVAKEVGTIISLDGGAQRYDEDMKPITEASHIVIVARDYAEYRQILSAAYGYLKTQAQLQ